MPDPAVYGGISVVGRTRQFVALKIVGSNPTFHPRKDDPRPFGADYLFWAGEGREENPQGLGALARRRIPHSTPEKRNPHRRVRVSLFRAEEGREENPQGLGTLARRRIPHFTPEKLYPCPFGAGVVFLG